MIPIILASSSASRAELLRRAGAPFTIVPAGVDEAAIKAAMLARGATAAEVAERLATEKATIVSRRSDALVIGADQTLDLEGRLIDKTRNREEVRDRLLALRGRRHQLHSAVVVSRRGQRLWGMVTTASMSMRHFTDEFLDDYLALCGHDIEQSIGGYQYEGLGVNLFAAVDGDFHAILGLPLVGLLGFLRDAGGLPS